MARARPQQPGQVTTRSLRVGIVLGKKLVEERVFRKRKTLTIGQSAKNDFCVPTRGMPKTFPMFTVENGQYLLYFKDGWDGRVADGGGEPTSIEFEKGKRAFQRDGAWVLPLGEHSRGKVKVGGMTLLFQFVNAPPLQPRPRLPASVRGTLADRIEPRLAIILLLSLFVHSGLMVWALTHDRVVTSRIDRLHQEFQEESFRERVAISTFTVPTTTAESDVVAEEEGGEEETTTKIKRKGDGGGKKKDTGDSNNDAPDDAAIQEMIQNTAFIKIATGGEGGSRYSQMNETDQGAELADAMNRVEKSGATVASKGNPGAGSTRGPRSGKLGTGKGPSVGGPGEGTKVATKAEETIKSRASFDVDDLDMTTLDPEAVARKIRSRYLSGIQKCHQVLLKRDPRAGGRVQLKFTVSIAGKLVKSSVNGFDPGVDSCIKNLMTRWRFAAPKDDDGNPTTAAFVIPLVLKPGG